MTTPAEYLIPKDLYASSSPAVLCGDQTLTYVQFFNAVSIAASYLKNHEIQAGDRIGILSSNSTDYLIALFALWQIEAVACPLNMRLPDDALKEQLQSLKCRHLLSADNASDISDVVHIDLNNIVEMHGSDDVETQNFSEAAPERSERCASLHDINYPLDQDATIIFTSGSTAKPKAVLHTLGNHYYSAKGSNEHIRIAPGDRWLLSLPLYHIGGLSIVFRTFLEEGSVVIPKPQESIEQALVKYNITHLSLVSTQLIRLLKNEDCHSHLKNLKAILLGGSAIPDSLIQDSIKLNLPVYMTYGLTEMASQVATSNRLTEENSASAAKILNYRRLMISQEGEIFVKGEVLFKGYVEDTQIHLPINKNGCFATGDVGHFSSDGGLIVSGRKDNMFISGGENIQPEEIEKSLCQIEGIEQAIVVPVRDDEFGFRPAAFIKEKEGCTVKKSEVSEFLLKYLPKFKVPEQFYSWPDGLESDALKINRQELSRSIPDIVS